MIRRDKYGMPIPDRTERDKISDTFMYLAICCFMLSIFFSFILAANPHGRVEQIIVGVLMLIAEASYYLMKAVDLPQNENKWI